MPERERLDHWLLVGDAHSQQLHRDEDQRLRVLERDLEDSKRRQLALEKALLVIVAGVPGAAAVYALLTK